MTKNNINTGKQTPRRGDGVGTNYSKSPKRERERYKKGGRVDEIFYRAQRNAPTSNATLPFVQILPLRE